MIATYGRIRYVAEVVSTRTDRLITVGGAPSYRGFGSPEAYSPPGMPIPTSEDAPRVEYDMDVYIMRLADVTRGSQTLLY